MYSPIGRLWSLAKIIKAFSTQEKPQCLPMSQQNFVAINAWAKYTE